MSWTDDDGVTTTQPEPELDWIDLAILAAWDRLNASLCSLCGRPWAVHKDDKPDDYNVGARTCTATAKLTKVQAEQAAKERDQIERGEDPDRARVWMSWTDAEGQPSA